MNRPSPYLEDTTGMPMVIALTGYAGAGKSTVAQYLHEEYDYKIMSFAYPVRKTLEMVNPVVASVTGLRYNEAVERHGYTEAKRRFSEIRQLQINLAENSKERFGPDYWALQWAAEFGQLAMDTKVVVDDLRFLAETEAVLGWGGQIWRVWTHDGVPTEHDTEQDLIAADKAIDNSLKDPKAMKIRVDDALGLDFRRWLK